MYIIGTVVNISTSMNNNNNNGLQWILEWVIVSAIMLRVLYSGRTEASEKYN